MVLPFSGAAILSGAGLLQSSPTSATVSLTRVGTNSTNAVGEAIEFEATDVSGLDLSGYTYTLADAPLDQLVEWYWTITAPGGAATTWSAPTRLAPGHNARLTAYGRRGFIIPDVAGTWTFAVFGVDKNGATVSASASCEVVTTSSVVTDQNSWVLYTDTLPGGGVEGTDYATGRAYATWDNLVTALEGYSGGGAVRVRLQGGSTWSAANQFFPRFSNYTQLIMEPYGSGRATINTGSEGFYDDTHAENSHNLQLRGIDIIPEWDMTTESPFGADGGWNISATAGSPRAISFSDGSLTGLGGNATTIKVYCENIDFLDGPEFNIIGQTPMFVRGSNFDAPAASLMGGRRNENSTDSTWRNAHGNLRENGFQVLDGCTFHNQGGWSYTTGGEWVFTQQTLRFIPSGTTSPGGRLNIQRCIFEPGLYILNTNPGPEEVPTNVLIERSVFLSHHQFGNLDGMLDIRCSGVTVRNCALLGSSAGGSSSEFVTRTPNIYLKSDVSTDTTNTDPVRIIANTGIDLRTGARTYTLVNVVEAFSQQEITNNIEYAPNYDTPHQPDGALVAETGTTPVNTGSRLGYTHHQFTLASDLAVGATSGVFSWFNDVDGVAVDHTTFNTGAEKDNIFNNAITGYIQNFATTGDGVSVGGGSITINKTAGGWSITNNLDTGDTRGSFIVSGVLKAGTYRLQLDRRHDPVVKSGTASGANDGQLWAPASAVTPDDPAKVPHFDFFGHTRSSGSPTKGAIDPLGVAP